MKQEPKILYRVNGDTIDALTTESLSGGFVSDQVFRDSLDKTLTRIAKAIRVKEIVLQVHNNKCTLCCTPEKNIPESIEYPEPKIEEIKANKEKYNHPLIDIEI